MELPISTLEHGRRIYIHEYSFYALFKRAPDFELEILECIGLSWATRICGHQIDDAIDLAIVRPEVVNDFAGFVHRRWAGSTAQLFRGIAIREVDNSRPRLLRDREVCIATCYDSGYYTFATTTAAAGRMFDDSTPLRALYQDVKLGRGPDDLNIVRGNRLIISTPPERPVVRPAPDSLDSLIEAIMRPLENRKLRYGDLSEAEKRVFLDIRTTTERTLRRRLAWYYG